MNQEILAYAAGIFDGEGYVDIYKATKAKASKNPSFMLRVSIGQKDGRLMNWLQEHFGGYVRREDRNNTYLHRWDLRSQAAKRFLLLIQPFVLIKKDQVDLAIEFENRKGRYLDSLKGFQGFRSLTENEVKMRLEMQEKLKRLKKEYLPYIKNGAPSTTNRENFQVEDVIV